MTDANQLVPAGISHDHDHRLFKLTHPERMKLHRKELQTIAFYQGMDGVTAYKCRYPEAKRIRVMSRPIASDPKPSGYARALVRNALQWVTDDVSLAGSYRADVEQMNERYGWDFPPANHFSRPLAPTYKKQVAEELAVLGIRVPDEANTMGKIKETVRAWKSRGQSDAEPFGIVGSRSGDTLTISNENLTVHHHHGHDCIWLRMDGKPIRVRLDVMLAAYGLLVGGGGALSSSSSRRMGERRPNLENPPPDPLEDTEMELLPENVAPVAVSPDNPLGERRPEVPGMTASGAEPPPLSDRIAKLVAARAPPPTLTPPPGVDPLEWEPLEYRARQYRNPN